MVFDCTTIPVEELVPHSPPMVLLDRILQYDDILLTAGITISATSMFYESAIDGVPAWIGIEYMAQAISAFSGLRARERNIPVKLGLLLGSRKILLHEKVLRCGELYTVSVRQLVWDPSGLANFEGQIFLGSQLCVEARINVFESDNIKTMITGPQ
jgi:predicted hotdog family 3-hydroxylacyl-ACP dehydratase